MPDLAQAMTYTPIVLFFMQVAKSNSKWKNDWCIMGSVVCGLVIAVCGLWAIGKFGFGPGGIITEPALAFRVILEGLWGGAMAPAAYKAQAQLPIKLLQPGPDNNPSDAARAAAAASRMASEIVATVAPPKAEEGRG